MTFARGRIPNVYVCAGVWVREAGTRAAAAEAEARGEKVKIHHCREEKIVVPHEPFSGLSPRAGLEQDDGQPLTYPS